MPYHKLPQMKHHLECLKKFHYTFIPLSEESPICKLLALIRNSADNLHDFGIKQNSYQ